MGKSSKRTSRHKPIGRPRKGWDKAFKKMHKKGDDQLLLSDVFHDENFDRT